MFKNLGQAIRQFKITKKSVTIIVILVALTAAGVGGFMGKEDKAIAVAAPNKVSIKVSVAKTTLKNATASYKATLEASQEGIVSG